MGEIKLSKDAWLKGVKKIKEGVRKFNIGLESTKASDKYTNYSEVGRGVALGNDIKALRGEYKSRLNEDYKHLASMFDKYMDYDKQLSNKIKIKAKL